MKEDDKMLQKIGEMFGYASIAVGITMTFLLLQAIFFKA
jgi:hypothetical protein